MDKSAEKTDRRLGPVFRWDTRRVVAQRLYRLERQIGTVVSKAPYRGHSAVFLCILAPRVVYQARASAVSLFDDGRPVVGTIRNTRTGRSVPKC